MESSPAWLGAHQSDKLLTEPLEDENDITSGLQALGDNLSESSVRKMQEVRLQAASLEPTGDVNQSPHDQRARLSTAALLDAVFGTTPTSDPATVLPARAPGSSASHTASADSRSQLPVVLSDKVRVAAMQSPTSSGGLQVSAAAETLTFAHSHSLDAAKTVSTSHFRPSTTATAIVDKGAASEAAGSAAAPPTIHVRVPAQEGASLRGPSTGGTPHPLLKLISPPPAAESPVVSSPERAGSSLGSVSPSILLGGRSAMAVGGAIKFPSFQALAAPGAGTAQAQKGAAPVSSTVAGASPAPAPPAVIQTVPAGPPVSGSAGAGAGAIRSASSSASVTSSVASPPTPGAAAAAGARGATPAGSQPTPRKPQSLLSAQSSRYVGLNTRLYFNDLTHTLILPPDERLPEPPGVGGTGEDVRVCLADIQAALEARCEDGGVTRTEALAPLLLLTSQMPYTDGSSGDVLRWPPMLATGSSVESSLTAPVVAATAHPVTTMALGQYASHFASLLAAEVAKSRAEIPSYDIERVQLEPLWPERAQTYGSPTAAAAAAGQQYLGATVSVPGVAEGKPSLDYGSYVRLRPSAEAPHVGAPQLPPNAAYEIEARVERVAVAREQVLLRLPSRVVLRHCAVCLNSVAPQLNEAGRDALALMELALLPPDNEMRKIEMRKRRLADDTALLVALASSQQAVLTLWAQLRPVTHVALPCGDQVLCEGHANALQATGFVEIGEMCPLVFLTSPTAGTVSLSGPIAGQMLALLQPQPIHSTFHMRQETDGRIVPISQAHMRAICPMCKTAITGVLNAANLTALQPLTGAHALKAMLGIGSPAPAAASLSVAHRLSSSRFLQLLRSRTHHARFEYLFSPVGHVLRAVANIQRDIDGLLDAAGDCTDAGAVPASVPAESPLWTARPDLHAAVPPFTKEFRHWVKAYGCKSSRGGTKKTYYTPQQALDTYLSIVRADLLRLLPPVQPGDPAGGEESGNALAMLAKHLIPNAALPGPVHATLACMPARRRRALLREHHLLLRAFPSPYDVLLMDGALAEGEDRDDTWAPYRGALGASHRRPISAAPKPSPALQSGHVATQNISVFSPAVAAARLAAVGTLTAIGDATVKVVVDERVLSAALQQTEAAVSNASRGAGSAVSSARSGVPETRDLFNPYRDEEEDAAVARASHARATVGAAMPSPPAIEDDASREAADDVIAACLGIKWVDARLNAVQRRAVTAIVSGGHGPIPFLLIGPAGTGKTSTLAEAISQVLLTSSSRAHAARGRILIVAPSDEAADVALSGLVSNMSNLTACGLVPVSKLGPDGWQPLSPSSAPLGNTGPVGVLRYNLHTRRWDSMAGRPALWEFCLTDPPMTGDPRAAYESTSDRIFVPPTGPQLAACRVIVCTAVAAGSLGRLVARFAQDVLNHDVRSGAVVMPLLTPAGAIDTSPSALLRLTHAFYDEASQALEPESLVPLSLTGPATRVVLTGDPRQLGPVVRSTLARERGLGISLQERLLAGFRRGDSEGSGGDDSESAATSLQELVTSALRTTDAGRDLCVYSHPQVSALLPRGAALSATLNINYRSHPLLLTVPSRLFYGSTLVSRASLDLTMSCNEWSVLPRAGEVAGVPGTGALSPSAAQRFPMLCIGADGDDRVDPESQTYSNLDEVAAVVWAVKALLGEFPPPGARPLNGVLQAPLLALPCASTGGVAQEVALPAAGMGPRGTLRLEDIGVITPYRQQVMQLRLAMRKEGLAAVSVGTVLNFQGQEKKVIFLSTVLSRAYEDEAARRRMLQDRANAALSPSPDAPLLSAAFLTRTMPAAGLCHDAKSFNVATTRAHSLMVCVGNPRVWVTDGHWRALLQHAVDNGAYLGWKGAPCPLTPSASGLWAAGTEAAAPLPVVTKEVAVPAPVSSLGAPPASAAASFGAIGGARATASTAAAAASSKRDYLAAVRSRLEMQRLFGSESEGQGMGRLLH